MNTTLKHSLIAGGIAITSFATGAAIAATAVAEYKDKQIKAAYTYGRIDGAVTSTALMLEKSLEQMIISHE